MSETALNSKPRWEKNRHRGHVYSCHWNLEGKRATKVAFPQEPLKLPVLKSCCPAEKHVDLVMTLVYRRSWCTTATRTAAVTGEDIVDKLLFVVHILKECDDLYALTN